MPHSAKVWLLSAYHADSHASWANWLMNNFPQLDWQLATLPGRHFRWRIRGNPLSWLGQLPEQTPDLLIATSMVDLATLRGLRPDLAAVPSIYYFHENQFAYPPSGSQHSSIDPQMVQLYGALCADRVLFNSAFNRNSCLRGIDQLMARLPDHTPDSLSQTILSKSRVLAVPINAITGGEKTPGLILWNHRWEYDKAPQVFAEALGLLREKTSHFSLALLGPRATKPHPALQKIRDTLRDHIAYDDLVSAEQYQQIVAKSQIVVSTAIHEFQGLAVMQASSSGARPVVPDALCYPEQYPEKHRYPAGDAKALANKLASWLQDGLPDPVDISAWDSEQLKPTWQDAMSELSATVSQALGTTVPSAKKLKRNHLN